MLLLKAFQSCLTERVRKEGGEVTCFSVLISTSGANLPNKSHVSPALMKDSGSEQKGKEMEELGQDGETSERMKRGGVNHISE